MPDEAAEAGRADGEHEPTVAAVREGSAKPVEPLRPPVRTSRDTDKECEE